MQECFSKVLYTFKQNFKMRKYFFTIVRLHPINPVLTYIDTPSSHESYLNEMIMPLAGSADHK